MNISRPMDIGIVIRNLYEKHGLKKELIAEFLNLDIGELDSFENGYHFVNAFDLERFCALFGCELCPSGIDTTNYRSLETEKPSDKLDIDDLESIVSKHLEVSNLIYVPQI